MVNIVGGGRGVMNYDPYISALGRDLGYGKQGVMNYDPYIVASFHDFCYYTFPMHNVSTNAPMYGS